ncbi:hypothetical protein Corgl_0030 [Coriobacterium glomerans PW2]|uniref:Uncharacterized protein n=1 Tax=Coriobacterium glomerans (strain ATCC 49209 / DSM 20642 / JCM 10262 / PW2) TaxID=700015 RepID=F2N6W0_CORGP|nr:hypothetical protein Corgl_0030 [Coriobacterium glomerans PW2]
MAADYYDCALDELAGRPWPPNVDNPRKTTVDQ